MYSKVVLDALVERATDKEISRMVVLINQFSAYRDYADFHKHDPEWWESLGEKVYTQSPYPKMALAPLLIAASQYLLDPEIELEEKVMPLVGKAMAINEEDDSVQTIAKVVVGLKVGGLERPTMKELRANVLPKLRDAVNTLDERLSRKE